VLAALPGNARLHQLRCGGAEDDFAMGSDVVRMSVAYEDFFRAEFRFVRIEPQAEFGNVQITGAVFDPWKGHNSN